FLVTRRLMRPLTEIRAALEQLAGNNLTVAVPHADRADEIGQMAQALEIFREAMLHNQALQQEQQALKQQAEADAQQSRLALRTAFERDVSQSLHNMADRSRQMDQSAATMAATAQENVQHSGSVANTAVHVSENVAAVAASVEELAASIR